MKARNLTEIECDDICMSKRKLAEEQKILEDAKKAEIEAERNRLELEHFEKKLAGKRKYRDRKNKEVVHTKEKDYSTLAIAVASGFIVALTLYFTIFQ